MLGAVYSKTDYRPSCYRTYRRLRNLNASRDTLFRALFMVNLSPNVRVSLDLLSSKSTKELVAKADRIMDMSRLSPTTEVNRGAGMVSSKPISERGGN